MDDETPEQFLTSLRKLAIDSGLAEDEKSYNRIVIGRFIAGISDHDMRQKIMTSSSMPHIEDVSRLCVTYCGNGAEEQGENVGIGFRLSDIQELLSRMQKVDREVEIKV